MKNCFFKFASFLILVMMLLSSCAKGNKFEMQPNGFVDKKTGVEYVVASWEYEPITVTDQIYGKYKEFDVEFFCLEGVDPAKLVADHVGTLYHSSDIKLPELSEMNISHVNIYDEEDKLVRNISDAEFISALQTLYANGYNAYETIEIMNSDFEINQRFKFANEELGVYYVLAYTEYTTEFTYKDGEGKECTGKNVLYNRFAKKYVVIDDFISDYFNREVNN